MEFIGKIKFMKEDLLTIAEFKKLIDARSPNDRADILAEKFKKYCFIYHQLIFTLNVDEVVYYEYNTNIKNILINSLTSYLSESKKQLTDEQHKALLYEHKKYMMEFVKMHL